MLTVDQFVDRALSVPFKVGGRNWDGWDCWGLVFVAYREMFGVEIAKLSDQYDDKTTFEELNALINTQRPEWRIIGKPKLGDIRLFKVSRYQTHTALVLSPRTMIHAMEGVGTAVERLDVIQWAKRHVEYFRHERGIGPGGAASAQS